MNEDNSQPLAQLRDIHSAGDPGWWPPAPGWWVLAVVILLALFLLMRILAKKAALMRRRREWVRALDSLGQEYDPVSQPHDYLAAINRLFRAVALKAFPQVACARLQGSDWVDFILAQMPEKTDVSSLLVLAKGPYQAVPEFNAPALEMHARTWVRLHG